MVKIDDISRYDLKNDPIHRHDKGTRSFFDPPGHPAFRSSLDAPTSSFPHNMVKLGFVRHHPTQSAADRCRRYWEDVEAAPRVYLPAFIYTHPALRCDQCARDDLVCMQARLDWNSDIGPIRMEGCLTCLSGCTNEGQDITNLYKHSISENKDVEKAVPDETDGLQPVGAPTAPRPARVTIILEDTPEPDESVLPEEITSTTTQLSARTITKATNHSVPVLRRQPKRTISAATPEATAAVVERARTRSSHSSSVSTAPTARKRKHGSAGGKVMAITETVSPLSSTSVAELQQTIKKLRSELQAKTAEAEASDRAKREEEASKTNIELLLRGRYRECVRLRYDLGAAQRQVRDLKAQLQSRAEDTQDGISVIALPSPAITPST